MNSSTNAINWFEIPVTDLDRARHFYQVIFSIHMNDMDMGGMKMALFPMGESGEKVSGALVQSNFRKPSSDGVAIYLNGGPDLNEVLSKVIAEGGSIQTEKTEIGQDMGYFAFFTDTEGNTVGLHSQH